ncbi:MAG: helix-turn-helix domain-containing protein [Streptosporangiales bacterium]|nr:helix-turn-helix domain-containing protein [Streptosporangiales bacterium]
MPETEHTPGGKAGVQSIDRAVAVLRCFGPQRPELGISELARTTGLSTSTVHRLLVAMQRNGLVRQVPGRRYTLGPLLVQLARSGLFPATVRDAAIEVMHELRDRFDETVAVHELLPTYERAVVDQVESRQELRRTYIELGAPIALPLGAPGKVMLAYVPAQVRDAILGEPIAKVTATTVTDVAELRAQLDEIRETGYAYSYAERTPGIRTVAAALFDHTGEVVGALSISGPEMRMPHEHMVELAPPMAEAAWQVSVRLGATVEGLAECKERAAG